jgi:phosphate transport system substrate-binding protein
MQSVVFATVTQLSFDSNEQRRWLMRRFATLLVTCLAMTLGQPAFTPPAFARDLCGSGSTFAFPVVARWAQVYEKASGVRIQYQPIGSSAGVTEIQSGVVDFGITDAPLVDAQLVRDGLTQFPLVIGGIVPVVNLDGVGSGQLRLTGPVLADIFLGKVRRWNDPALVALNPDLTLPNLAILVVTRSDGSGTTFNFTDYLAKASPEFRGAIGAGTLVRWPGGVSGKGNAGVAAAVTRVKGSIGYLEYSYAATAKMAYALVRNQAGNYVAPSAASFQAAVAGVNWLSEPDFHISTTDAAPADAFPIVATSFVLLRTYPKDGPQAQEIIGFFRWALESGQELATNAGYLPLPNPLVQQIEAAWAGEVRRF